MEKKVSRLPIKKRVFFFYFFPANFLLDSACKDPDLRVVTEALDKTFDLFGEDDGPLAKAVEKTAASVDLVRRLKAAQTTIKAKMATARKAGAGGDPEVLALAAMAKTNLSRFVKYKEKKKK